MAATSLAALATRTTAAGRVRANGPVLHPRLVAVVTALSCAAHLWVALSGHHGVWVSVLMLALAAVCLPCAVHIWRRSGPAALHQVTAAAVAMAVLHAVLLLGGGAGHVHGGAPPSSVADSGGPQLLLLIALELSTALLAATLVARLRRR
ncbi:hypothetical protein [Pseudarthrobacter sp. fls2-241-R2A-127]|uniref:hypothetical protein n=1 Tax=Pseudarthrobacter sp. fls2-241-R2A-127 TaxID=3040303 RepID=UPI002556A54A|nr:hypothetical protein [Pseudarthrobacter sp. fls2-241-R2A-127]